MGRLILQCFALALAWAQCCVAFEPEVLWRKKLPGGGRIQDNGLRKGNGVVTSKDGKSLWVTNEAGSLFVFDLTKPDVGAPIEFKLGSSNGGDTECRSSVSLFESDGGVQYAVYAVIDIPKADAVDTPISSRIIAVNGKGDELGTLRWKRTVSGIAVGTPVISSDGKNVYITHNIDEKGTVTVLVDDDGGSIVSEITDDDDVPYGAAAISSIDGNDSIYWGVSTDNGYARSGRIHSLEGAEHRIGNLWESSVVVAPTFSSDKKSMFVAGRSSKVYGWTSGNFNRSPMWTAQLPLSLRNETYPIVNRIVTSTDDTRLFVASATRSFHCLDASNGDELWSTTNGTSVFVTEARYSPKNDLVYMIEHLDGAILQHDATTGSTNWRFDCRDITRNPICQGSVEAEFSLSSDETILYFGDIYGNVNAIRVADPVPTASPSSMPSGAPSESPSSPPSAYPSSRPTQSPTTYPSMSPSASPSGTAFRSPPVYLPPTQMPTFSPESKDSPSSSGCTQCLFGSTKLYHSAFIVAIVVVVVRGADDLAHAL